MPEVSEKTHVRARTFSSFVRLECYEFSVPYGSLRECPSQQNELKD